MRDQKYPTVTDYLKRNNIPEVKFTRGQVSGDIPKSEKISDQNEPKQDNKDVYKAQRFSKHTVKVVQKKK